MYNFNSAIVVLVQLIHNFPTFRSHWKVKSKLGAHLTAALFQEHGSAIQFSAYPAQESNQGPLFPPEGGRSDH